MQREAQVMAAHLVSVHGNKRIGPQKQRPRSSKLLAILSVNEQAYNNVEGKLVDYVFFQRCTKSTASCNGSIVRSNSPWNSK